jgi:hypothetical protein
MGRMKVGIVTAVSLVALLGVGCGSDSGPVAKKSPTAVAPGTSLVPPTDAPSAAPVKDPSAPDAASPPADAATLATVPQPSAQDIQNLIAGITAQLQVPPASTGSSVPLTQEQIEAQVREQLAQLGITY